MNLLFYSISHQKRVGKFVTIRVEIHAYVSHHSFICVTLLLHMCEITVWNYLKLLIHSCDMTRIGIINHGCLLPQTLARTHLIRVCHYNHTKWRGILVAFILQVIFCKTATIYWAHLLKETCKFRALSLLCRLVCDKHLVFFEKTLSAAMYPFICVMWHT